MTEIFVHLLTWQVGIDDGWNNGKRNVHNIYDTIDIIHLLLQNVPNYVPI